MWSLEEMAERLKCRNAMQVGASLSVLIRNGVISRHDSGTTREAYQSDGSFRKRLEDSSG